MDAGAASAACRGITMTGMAMTMPQGEEAEARVAFAIERLLRSEEGWRGLVRDLVEGWPDAPPLELGFVLVCAASAIETAFSSGSPAHEAAMEGYRLAALLAVDVHAMELLGMPHARADDLHRYWEIDPFFAKL